MTEPRGALPRHRTATLPSFGDAAASATVSADPSEAAPPGAELVLAEPRPELAAESTTVVGGGHIAALDGLRALAVAVVLLYHAGVTEITRTLQAITRDRTRMLSYLTL